MSEIWLEEHDRGWSLPLAITLGSINIFVVLGNIFVLYILITQKSLHTSTNYIVLSLTLADFLLGVVILPFSMLQEYYSEWIFNELWCKIWLALDVLFSTASIYNLLAISFDRYMAVKQPIKYRFISSNRMIKITISTVWIISAFLAFPPLIYEHFFESQNFISDQNIKSSLFNSNNNVSIQKVCTPMTSNNFYILFSAMVSFILPTIFMIILNISIFQTVQDSRRPRLLPLPLTSQSSNGTTVSSSQGGSTCLRVHRGGGGSGSGSNGRAGSRNKNFKNSSTSSSMRGRNNSKNVEYPSLRGHSNSFRHYYNDTANTKEHMYVTMHRKRSSSISTLPNLAKIETLNNETKDGWMTTTAITTAQTDVKPIFVKAKTFEPIELRNNKYFPQQGIIEKTARNAIWYPAVLAAFVAEKKPTKYSQRMIFYPPINKSRQSLRTELRVARTIAIVVACFAICWLPFTIIYILQAFQTCPIDQCIPGWLFTIAFWLGYANSAVNPLLYAAVSRDFRSAFRKFLVGKGSRFHSRFSSAHRSS